jgi:hypothetical protein
MPLGMRFCSRERNEEMADGLGGCPMSLSLAQKRAMFPKCIIQIVRRSIVTTVIDWI